MIINLCVLTQIKKLNKGDIMNCEKSKSCQYLYGLIDFITFVGGAYLVSIGFFGQCCATCCGHLAIFGLPLIVFGLVLRSWRGKCCCCSCCTPDSNCCNKSK